MLILCSTRPSPINSVLVLLLLIVLTSSSSSTSMTTTVVATAAAADSGWQKLPRAALFRTRRFLNLSNLFGNASAQSHKYSPYERVTGHPVFAVTTPWGSPYMNMEKVDLDATGTSDTTTTTTTSTTPQSISEEQNEVRPVALYFMDPDDAMAVHGEMKQMESMQQTDIRLTAMSLAKALRQASCLSNGLPTGAPANPLNGQFDPSEGATLRYKIVPPKRQLYYAARCIGKERVGLFGETPAEDSQMVIMGTSAIEAANLARRREKRERKAISLTPKKTTSSSSSPLSQDTLTTAMMQAQNAHMEGYTGIPVFYCPAMRKQHPLLKRLVTGQAYEIPFFFNYEDLEQAWARMRQHSSSSSRHRKKQAVIIPKEPVNVEVFNLWDVLTSMDKDAWNQHKQRVWWKPPDLAKPFQRRFGKAVEPDLQDITFIPSSRSVEYKDSLSVRGNGKARLRPMR